MDNIVQRVKDEIKDMVIKSIKKAVDSGLMSIEEIPEIEIEEPKEKQYGDFAVNTAMIMAKQAKMAPRKIAEIIVNNINKEDSLIEK